MLMEVVVAVSMTVEVQVAVGVGHVHVGGTEGGVVINTWVGNGVNMVTQVGVEL